MDRPTIAELRAVAQPHSVVGRRSSEHWVGRLWARRASIHITRVLTTTRVTPNQVTVAMVVIGAAGAASLLLPGVLGTALCAVAVQIYLVADCVDGELARWRRTSSKRGAYLDRVGHYVVEGAMFALAGYHVTRTWASGWTTLAMLTSILVIMARAQTDLVDAVGGASSDSTDDSVVQPRTGAVRIARAMLHPLKVHRLTGVAEGSLFLLAADVLDSLGATWAPKGSLAVLAGVSILVFVGHGISVTNSGRLDR